MPRKTSRKSMRKSPKIVKEKRAKQFEELYKSYGDDNGGRFNNNRMWKMFNKIGGKGYVSPVMKRDRRGQLTTSCSKLKMALEKEY